MNDDRRSALLVRVWLEDGPETFRARLAVLRESGQGEPAQTLTVTLASTPSDVVTAVSEWLDRFVRDPGDTEGDR
jgi:hypothetical protein